MWDINNLRDEDWEKEKGKDDKEYPSLAVKSAKKCFEVMKADLKSEQVRVNLLWLKDFYKSVIEHDRDEWNLRNFATICIWLQQYDEAAALYKDLIVELSDKYYVWSELAKCIVDNDELKIGLLLKAKSIERDENFLGDIHLDLAEIFVKLNMRDAANDELKCYAENRQKMGWSLSDCFRSISNSLSSVVESPKSLDLNNCIRTAENYAFDKYEWVNFV